jgi:hypothetical protein
MAKQYLTPEHLNLLNQLIELNEKHHELIAGLEDGGHDLDMLDRAGRPIWKKASLFWLAPWPFPQPTPSTEV